MKLPYVLLVDDDPTTNYLNQLLLTKQAVADEVLVAHDGREALTVLASQPVPPSSGRPALILLDVNMPGLNGLEFLEQFRQLPAAQQQAHVIVMLTTSLHPRDVRRVQELAVVAGTVLKPLTADKLRTVLAEYVGSPTPGPSPAGEGSLTLADET